MFELAAADYGRLGPLFQPLAYHQAIRAILSGCMAGKVYVDDPARPQAALTWHKHRIYLAGRPGSAAFCRDLRELLAGAVYPQVRAAGVPICMLYYASEAWAEQAPEFLAGTTAIKARREYYVRQALPSGWQALLAAGFVLRPVDGRLLADAGLRNLDALRDEMCSERASIADFLAHSFGVCAVHGDEIAGWCLSEYNCADGCEIGIETVAGYRRRGLGTLMTCALVEHAQAQGIRHIGWDCFADHLASSATARKAGFARAAEYEVYIARL